MKAFAISTSLFLLATRLDAAPTSNARQFEAQLTFEGAPPDVAFYTVSAPTGYDSTFYISMSPAPSPSPSKLFLPPLSVYLLPYSLPAYVRTMYA